MDAKIWFKGMSTDKEVKALAEFFLVLKEGDVASHDSIADLIGAEHGGHRYQTIVNRVRKMLFRDYNIELGTMRNMGYKILPPAERVTKVSRDFHQTGRKMRQIGTHAVAVPTENLSEQQKELLTHHQIAIAKTVNTYDSMRPRAITKLTTIG